MEKVVSLGRYSPTNIIVSKWGTINSPDSWLSIENKVKSYFSITYSSIYSDTDHLLNQDLYSPINRFLSLLKVLIPNSHIDINCIADLVETIAVSYSLFGSFLAAFHFSICVSQNSAGFARLI